MMITNPELYQELESQFQDLLRQCISTVLENYDFGQRLKQDVVEQCLSDVIALGFNDDKESAVLELTAEMENNPLVEEVYPDEIKARLDFSDEVFMQEIGIFKEFIESVNSGDREEALRLVNARIYRLNVYNPKYSNR